MSGLILHVNVIFSFTHLYLLRAPVFSTVIITNPFQPLAFLGSQNHYDLLVRSRLFYTLTRNNKTVYLCADLSPECRDVLDVFDLLWYD